MGWVVDTCLILDVLTGDSCFAGRSAELIDAYYPEGLLVCPVSYIELAPAFLGVKQRQDEFLSAIGIGFVDSWNLADTVQAHKAWARQIDLKREGKNNRRPIADILIGAFAFNRKGLLTRNAKDFSTAFPDLNIITPQT